MINFIIVTHGEFGAYLVEAAESIVGRQEGVRVVSISSRLSVPEVRQRIVKALDNLRSPDGIVLFIDMPGGTPGNLSFPLIKDIKNVEIVSGVNLYMLICAFNSRGNCALAELVSKTIDAGQRSIKDIRSMFLSKA